MDSLLDTLIFSCDVDERPVNDIATLAPPASFDGWPPDSATHWTDTCLGKRKTTQGFGMRRPRLAAPTVASTTAGRSGVFENLCRNNVDHAANRGL